MKIKIAELLFADEPKFEIKKAGSVSETRFSS